MLRGRGHAVRGPQDQDLAGPAPWLRRNAPRARGPRPGSPRSGPSGSRAPHRASARRPARAHPLPPRVAAARAVRSPQGRIECRRLGEREGKDRAVAVDDVEGQQQRDAEAALLERDPLHLARPRSAPEIEQAADLAGPDRCQIVGRHGRAGYREPGAGHRELTKLLFERHRPQQGLDARRRVGRCHVFPSCFDRGALSPPARAYRRRGPVAELFCSDSRCARPPPGWAPRLRS